MMIDIELLNKLFKSPFKKKLTKDLQKIIVPYDPIITQNDVRRGYIKRYFVRNRNYLENLTEISEVTYNDLKNNLLYITAEVKWKIVGKLDTYITPAGATVYGVLDLNKKAITRADLTIEGLASYIIDYKEFWLGESI
jgi:hypothetical protein